MTLHRLTDTLYIAAQLDQAAVAEAAKLGIRSVICNRPDGEEAGQAEAAQVRQWLAEAGIREFVHQPVVAPNIDADDAAEFQRLLTQLPAPVLAYCRTGTRCTVLFAANQMQNGQTLADTLAQAESIGINLAPFAEKLNGFAR